MGLPNVSDGVPVPYLEPVTLRLFPIDGFPDTKRESELVWTVEQAPLIVGFPVIPSQLSYASPAATRPFMMIPTLRLPPSSSGLLPVDSTE